MRKTIRRGIFVTATAACALGFGLFQASAATVPTLPAVPELPLTSLTNLGQGVAVAPTMPTLPALPGEDTTGSRSLPTDGIPAAGLVSSLTSLLGGLGAPQRADLPGSDLAPEFSELTSLLALDETTDGLGAPQLGDVTGATQFANLPTEGLAPAELPAELPTADLPTGDLGLPAVAPGQLPVGLQSDKLPALPKLPSETNEITKAPVVDLPETDRLPVVAQIDHNGLAQKLIPNTDGVDVQGLPKPEVPNLSSTPDAVQLPATAPQKPGMQSFGVPQQLPVVSSVDLPEAPSIHDVTGDMDLPAQLPQLPTV